MMTMRTGKKGCNISMLQNIMITKLILEKRPDSVAKIHQIVVSRVVSKSATMTSHVIRKTTSHNMMTPHEVPAIEYELCNIAPFIAFHFE